MASAAAPEILERPPDVVVAEQHQAIAAQYEVRFRQRVRGDVQLLKATASAGKAGVVSIDLPSHDVDTEVVLDRQRGPVQPVKVATTRVQDTPRTASTDQSGQAAAQLMGLRQRRAGAGARLLAE